ncbi:MAG: caspase family protein [Pirellulales bacterium]|nr:caspase family protein [Pirellulales bacterium]
MFRRIPIIALISAMSLGDGRGEQLPTAYLCVNIEGHTAPVRALAFAPDSEHLCTAGLDKVVNVWRLPPRRGQAASLTKNIAREFFGREHTLRWEVARGRRGSINAMAFSAASGRLVVGGFGARGATGDLAWLDPAAGTFLEAKYQHRNSIMSLACSPDGRWLASLDFDGRVLLWSTDGGEPREICKSDAEAYGAEAVQAIRTTLESRPLSFAGDRTLCVPVYTGVSPDQRTPTWKIRTFSIPGGTPGAALEPVHFGRVTALAGSANGRYLASADLAGRFYLWDLGAAGRQAKLLAERIAIQSLGFNPTGNVLLVGTFPPGGLGESELQIREIPSGTIRRVRKLDDAVTACTVSSDGLRVAYTGGRGHEVFVEWLDEPHEPVVIPGGEQVDGIARQPAASDHRVVFRSRPGRDDAPRYQVFDPEKLNIAAADPVTTPSPANCGKWNVVLDAKSNRLWLAVAGQKQCTGYVELDPNEQGRLRCWCWIVDRNGEPYAVAIGTDVQHGVYVYGLNAAGPCPLLRYFRGHNGMVNALTLSPDCRYLVSGSADGTIRYWNLDGCGNPSAVYRNWGAEFAAEGQRLVVRQIDELGPLYNKGVRQGDALDRILWKDEKGDHGETRAAELLVCLEKIPWQTQVAFFFSRRGEPMEGFQSVAGWYSLLAAYVSGRDWIAWTPEGYYACSAGGERLIGWQVNNNPGEAPSFFTAEQFNKTFFRKDVIRGVLEEGSVAKTLAGLAGQPGQSAPVPAAVVSALPPRVTILTPTQNRLEQAEREITVTARADAAAGQPIVAMSLLIDGRPYDAKRRFQGSAGDRMSRTERWVVQLQPGSHSIVVKAESELSEGLSEAKQVFYKAPPPKPSLYAFAVGISSYPGNLRLNYAHSDALALAATLKANSGDLFDTVEVRSQVNEGATQEAIRDGLVWLHRSAKPGDVALFFYSGHGMNDAAGDFYLVPVDGTPDRPAETCVSSSLLREFCAKTTRCKLVVLLDACHSGRLNLCNFLSITEAVEDLTRELGRNDYGVVMMASSCGEETSLELNEIQAGAFTKALVEGFEGNADSDGDQFILVPMEAHSYTWRRVRELTAQKQTPINSNTGVKDFPITHVTRPGIASR